MATPAHFVEQEVFSLERVRITIHVPGHTVVPQRYARMFPVPLPDTATLAELITRVNLCLGNVLYGVVNPLGSPTKISSSTPLSAVRAYYAPRDRETEARILRARVSSGFRKMAAKLARAKV